MVDAILAGVAVRFIAAVTKSTVKGLFSDDDLQGVLAQAFREFQESSMPVEGRPAEKKRFQEVFAEFFADRRTIAQFQLVFAASADEVDFNMLEEIFTQLGRDKGLKTPGFNFFQAMALVIKQIEALARRVEISREAFKVADLDRIFQHLARRGQEFNLSYARLKYLECLIRHHRPLQFGGIPDLKEKQDIALPSVFVMQRAVESVPVEDYRRFMLERAGEPGFDGAEIHLRRRLAASPSKDSVPVKFHLVLDNSPNHCFVVLGKPGSGKSSLLKFLLLDSAQKQLENHRAGVSLLFPILVEIRQLEKAFSKTSQPGYNILDFLYDAMRNRYQLTLPGGFFEGCLESGRALLMFDGLDEVADESRRDMVRQMIAAFVAAQHPGNTVLVTSRIAGYSRAQFSTSQYRHFTLEDFNDEEIDTFSRKWYGCRMTNPVDADVKARDLTGALEQKPGLKELARNPLMLTIIAIIHRYEAQLPADRLLLYDKATEALLFTWDNVKEIIDEKFTLADKRRFLEKVGFHLQSLEKGDEAGTVMERQELYKILFPDFCRIFNVDNRQARALVEEFLARVRERAGLLVEQAPGQFGFVHKTFQEYFAGQWIANEALLNFDLQIMIDYVDQFIDNAFWQETLLLALRALPNKQAQKVLDHILKRDPKGIESYFYHNHYFVMKFLAGQGRWLDNRLFVEQQLDDFFAFSWNGGKERGFYSNKAWKRYTDWIPLVTDSWVGTLLIEKLLPIASDEKQDGFLRRSCAETLGNLGIKDQAVVELLLGLAMDEKQDVYLRRDCAEALGKLGIKNQAADILMGLAVDKKQGGYLRHDCAEALRHLGFQDKAGEVLFGLATDEKQDGYIRRYCAEALGNLEFKDQAADILLGLAGKEKQDGDHRRYCINALGNLGYKNQKVMEDLLGLASDEKQSGYIRHDCAEALYNLGRQDQVDDIFLELVMDENQNYDLRRSCAAYLGKLDLQEQAIKILLDLAVDEKQIGSIRRECAKALNNLGRQEEAVDILLGMATDEKHPRSFRCDCAEALGNLGFKDQAMEILLCLADEKKQGGPLRRYYAEALGRLGENEKAIDLMVPLYLAQPDKSEDEARVIYNSLWNLTVI